MRGVSASIYRSDLGDCTNGGCTSPARSEGKTFVVFDEGISDGNYTLDECRDDTRFVCLKVVRRHIGGGLYLHLESMFEDTSGRAGPMAGGNYAFTPDSRFRRLFTYPLPVHDRYEDLR